MRNRISIFTIPKYWPTNYYKKNNGVKWHHCDIVTLWHCDIVTLWHCDSSFGSRVQWCLSYLDKSDPLREHTQRNIPSDTVATVCSNRVFTVDFARHNPVICVVRGAGPIRGTPAEDGRRDVLEVCPLTSTEQPTRFLTLACQLHGEGAGLTMDVYLDV